MSDPNGPFRYCIPCTYRGDDAFRNEAIAFVCGAVAATLGAPTGYSLPELFSRDFDVFVVVPNYLSDADCRALERCRLAVATSLEKVLTSPAPRWLRANATVKIGGPMLIGDSITMRIGAARDQQVQA